MLKIRRKNLLLCLTSEIAYGNLYKVVRPMPKTVGAKGYRSRKRKCIAYRGEEFMMMNSVLPSLEGLFYKLLSAENLKGGK